MGGIRRVGGWGRRGGCGWVNGFNAVGGCAGKWVGENQRGRGHNRGALSCSGIDASWSSSVVSYKKRSGVAAAVNDAAVAADDAAASTSAAHDGSEATSWA